LAEIDQVPQAKPIPKPASCLRIDQSEDIVGHIPRARGILGEEEALGEGERVLLLVDLYPVALVIQRFHVGREGDNTGTQEILTRSWPVTRMMIPSFVVGWASTELVRWTTFVKGRL
jgi:hypothetical protein